MADNKAAEEHKEQWEKLPGYVKGSMGFSFFLFIVILVVFISVELFLPLYRFYWSDSQGTASRLLVILSLFAVPITLNAAWYFYLRHWQNLRAWVYKNRKEASLFGGALIFGFVLLLYRFPGSGFAGKGLWDWLELLIFPVGFAIGGYLINSGIRERELKRTEEQQREQALKNYLEHMGILIHQELKDSKKSNPIRNMARAITLAVLRNLDGARKGLVIKFLSESELINMPVSENANSSESEYPIISLKDADITGAELSGIISPRINLSGADLSGATLRGAYLIDSHLNSAIFSGANLEWAYLNHANIQGSNFEKANLDHAKLDTTNLYSAIFNGASLKSARLVNARLNDAKLVGAKLEKANLTNADLTEADFQGAKLIGANLMNSILTRTNLKGAELTDAQVLNRELAQAILDETTIMPDGSNYKPPQQP